MTRGMRKRLMRLGASGSILLVVLLWRVLAPGGALAGQEAGPTASITANQGAFNVGEILRLNLSIAGVGESRTVDEYLFLVLPTGELIFFDLVNFHLASLDDPSTFVPAIRGLIVPPRTTLNSIVLELPFPDLDGLPAGAYTFGVVLTNPGSIEDVSSSFTTITFTKITLQPEPPPPPASAFNVAGTYIISGGISGEIEVSGGGSFFTGGVQEDFDVPVFSTFNPDSSRLVLIQNGNALAGSMMLLEEEPEFLVDVVDPSILGTISDAGEINIDFSGTFTQQNNPSNTTTFSGRLSGNFMDGGFTLTGPWRFENRGLSFSVIMNGVRE